MTRTQQIAQLKADRESLEPLREKAMEENDQEELQRIKKLTIEINRALDDLLFDAFADAALRLEEIAKEIAAAKRRAEEDSNFYPGLANLDVEEDDDDFEDEIPDDGDTVDDDTSTGNPAIEDEDLSLPAPDSSTTGELLLNEAHLLALWKRSQFPVFAGGLITFGVRGALPIVSSGTQFGAGHEIFISPINYRTMNCTIGQWFPASGFAVFPGSTVPYGPSVERRIPANGVGINQLGMGRYKRYVSGWHKRSEGQNGHWALLQDCAITLQRTGDDADYDLADRWESGKIAGDNIHCAFHMGPDANIPSSKYSSFGCQVIAGTVKKGVQGSETGPWKKFIEPFQKDGQKQTEYVLFSASEVQQMIKTRCAGKTILLRVGSQGDYVRLLQKRLSEKLGRFVAVDGDFGPGTFEAVLEFQEAEFGPEYDDGIVGPETAQKLGMTLPLFDFEDAISGGSGLVVSESGTSEAERDTPPPHNNVLPTATGIRLTEETFKKIAMQPSPGARARRTYDGYMSSLCSDEGTRMLSEYKINKNANRLAHFLAQVAHETGGFTLKRESLHYTTVGAVRRAWRSRASNHSDEWIRSNLLRNPVALGTWAYGGRMGNGRTNDDGYRYRGGGIMQTTGRDAYRRMGRIAGVDLEGNPDLIEQPLISLRAACAEWKSLKANSYADANKIKKNIQRD